MESKKTTLSDCFSELINPAPASYDPEDDIYEDTVAKVVENEVEFSDEISVSTFRKRKVDFVEEGNERYDGAKISRKALKTQHGDTDDEWETDEGSSAAEDSYTSEADEKSVDSPEDCHVEMNRNTALQEEHDEGTIFQHMSSRSMETEVEKAIAVRNQLNLWDSLLECRIKLQKTLVAANTLPQYNIFEHFITQGGSKFKTQIRRTKGTVTSLLDSLISFQKEMLKSYPETRNLNKNISECPTHESDEIASDTGEEEANMSSGNEAQEQKELDTKTQNLEDYAELISHHHKKYSEYCNAVIQKWNDKTRVLAGKLSSRNFSTFEQSTLKQIEQILSNRQRLIQRTQLKRSNYNILGQELVPQEQKNPEGSVALRNGDNLKADQEEPKEYITEIYDDMDYYHQLLRELIERKSSDVTDPVQLGRQWLELQKLRSKMKRKVDTRATKGRKIRYVVHSKLVNYMAPVSQSVFTEESKTELFNSLFGKGGRQQ